MPGNIPRFAALTLILALTPACSRQPTPQEQQAQGQTLYETYCAACHEVDRGIGPRLTKEVLATRLPAASLFRYTRKNMPYQAGNTLTEQQYWDITAYLLAHHGLLDDAVVLGPETADGTSSN